MAPASTQQTVVLVTGANQGLGFETVQKLAAEQSNYILILASRNGGRGKEAAGKITKLAAGTKVDPVELDVTSDDSIAAAAKYVEQTYGRLDVLFNNAGIGHVELPLREAMRKVIETNAISAACVTEAFLPLLKKAALPRLLFMSSSLGSITLTLDPTYPFYGWDAKPYLTSKAAMNMVGAQYAVILGKEGFKVNMIHPGFLATNMNGYHKDAGKAVDGATTACKLITDEDKNGPHAAFMSDNGEILPW